MALQTRRQTAEVDLRLISTIIPHYHGLIIQKSENGAKIVENSSCIYSAHVIIFFSEVQKVL